MASTLLEEEAPLPLSSVCPSQPDVIPPRVKASYSDETECRESGKSERTAAFAGDDEWSVMGYRERKAGEAGTRGSEENEGLLKEKVGEDMMRDDASDGDVSGVSDRLTRQLERNVSSPDFLVGSPSSKCSQPSSSHSPQMATSPVKFKMESKVENGINRSLKSQPYHNDGFVAVEKEFHHGDGDVGLTCETGSILVDGDSPSDDVSCSAEPERTIKFDLEAISLRLKSLSCGGKLTGESSRIGDDGGEGGQGRARFRAKIDPGSNAAAEDELSKEIK